MEEEGYQANLQQDRQLCKICKYPLPAHHTLCPDHWRNFDVTEYQRIQSMDVDDFTEDDCLNHI